MNEQNINKLFKVHKIDVPDDGFSERIMRRLPERKSILPQLVMSVCIIIGIAATFLICGVTPLIEQVNSLISSIGNLQIPSSSAVITYIGLLSLAGIIGYSLVKAETDW